MYPRILSSSAARRATVWLSALACALGGCGADAEHEVTGGAAHPIVGGWVSGPADDAVVKLVARASELEATVCSATAVAPNLVVTAAHCLARAIPGDVYCTAAGELEPADGPGRLIANVEPTLIEVHVGSEPDANPEALGVEIVSSGTTSICRNDLAFLVIDRALLRFAPIRADGRPIVGERVSVVGYGSTGELGEIGRHRVDDVRVEDVGPTSASGPLTGALPRTFVTGPSACGGDSGGPALSELGAVVGVSSLTIGDCTAVTVRNFFTVLPDFSSLIESAFAAAGAEVWREGSPAPGEPKPPSQASDGCSLVPPSARSWGGERLSWLVSFVVAACVVAWRRRERVCYLEGSWTPSA